MLTPGSCQKRQAVGPAHLLPAARKMWSTGRGICCRNRPSLDRSMCSQGAVSCGAREGGRGVRMDRRGESGQVGPGPAKLHSCLPYMPPPASYGCLPACICMKSCTPQGRAPTLVHHIRWALRERCQINPGAKRHGSHWYRDPGSAGTRTAWWWPTARASAATRRSARAGGRGGQGRFGRDGGAAARSLKHTPS